MDNKFHSNNMNGLSGVNPTLNQSYGNQFYASNIAASQLNGTGSQVQANKLNLSRNAPSVYVKPGNVQYIEQPVEVIQYKQRGTTGPAPVSNISNPLDPALRNLIAETEAKVALLVMENTRIKYRIAQKDAEISRLRIQGPPVIQGPAQQQQVIRTSQPAIVAAPQQFVTTTPGVIRTSQPAVVAAPQVVRTSQPAIVTSPAPVIRTSQTRVVSSGIPVATTAYQPATPALPLAATTYQPATTTVVGSPAPVIRTSQQRVVTGAPVSTVGTTYTTGAPLTTTTGYTTTTSTGYTTSPTTTTVVGY